MKKAVSMILILLSVFLLLCSCDAQEMLSGNLSIKYKIEDGKAIVTKLPDNSTLPEIVIPDEYEGLPVTEIADYAGVNLEYVTKITIGKNVEEIALWAFENAGKLTAFEVSEENELFCDKDGVLYTKDMKTLLFYPLSRDVKSVKDENGNEVKSISYEVPEGVETIRTKAFYKCSMLSEITLPSTLKTIEEKAFFRCSIGEITLPEELTFIGKDAFGYCQQLKEITIPATVKEIGEYAFYNCTSLLNITVNSIESEMTLGKQWYPTNNGLDIKELVINWNA
ncbi:MAG: leucine-rich repeat domain-containing protein [Clostridia bacterium]|nr:leucine-rich repeat domain-containing protein [Clostridia bacterium]